MADARMEFPEGREINRAVMHEVKLTLGGSVVVNGVWWFAVNVVGIMFPLMHFALVFGALIFLPVLDHKEYPEDPPISIYIIRALTNILLLFLALIVVGPFGVLLQTQVPTGILQFFMSWITISAIFAAIRAAVHGASILTKYYT